MSEQNEQQSENTNDISHTQTNELLWLFNETAVEPINHTRKNVYEDECLSYL
jgi:hypothetical protein